jgi:hypothetical protein
LIRIHPRNYQEWAGIHPRLSSMTIRILTNISMKCDQITVVVSLLETAPSDPIVV